MAEEKDPEEIAKVVVSTIKSGGLFDQFRRECLEALDKREQYRQLQRRVENHVASFLSRQKWSETLSKNKLRENLRQHINQSEVIINGVQHIINEVLYDQASSFNSRIDLEVDQYLDTLRKQEKKDEEAKADTRGSKTAEEEKGKGDLEEKGDISQQKQGVTKPVSSSNVERTEQRTMSSKNKQEGISSKSPAQLGSKQKPGGSRSLSAPSGELTGSSSKTKDKALSGKVTCKDGEHCEKSATQVKGHAKLPLSSAQVKSGNSKSLEGTRKPLVHAEKTSSISQPENVQKQINQEETALGQLSSDLAWQGSKITEGGRRHSTHGDKTTAKAVVEVLQRSSSQDCGSPGQSFAPYVESEEKLADSANNQSSLEGSGSANNQSSLEGSGSTTIHTTSSQKEMDPLRFPKVAVPSNLGHSVVPSSQRRADANDGCKEKISTSSENTTCSAEGKGCAILAVAPTDGSKCRISDPGPQGPSDDAADKTTGSDQYLEKTAKETYHCSTEKGCAAPSSEQMTSDRDQSNCKGTASPSVGMRGVPSGSSSCSKTTECCRYGNAVAELGNSGTVRFEKSSNDERKVSVKSADFSPHGVVDDSEKYGEDVEDGGCKTGSAQGSKSFLCDQEELESFGRTAREVHKRKSVDSFVDSEGSAVKHTALKKIKYSKYLGSANSCESACSDDDIIENREEHKNLGFGAASEDGNSKESSESPLSIKTDTDQDIEERRNLKPAAQISSSLENEGSELCSESQIEREADQTVEDPEKVATNVGARVASEGPCLSQRRKKRPRAESDDSDLHAATEVKARVGAIPARRRRRERAEDSEEERLASDGDVSSLGAVRAIRTRRSSAGEIEDAQNNERGRPRTKKSSMSLNDSKIAKTDGKGQKKGRNEVTEKVAANHGGLSGSSSLSSRPKRNVKPKRCYSPSENR